MFTFDIETIPNPDMIDRMPEPEVKLGALKDPEKIAAKKTEAKEAQIKKMALSPLYGKIAAIGYYSTDFSVCDILPESEMIVRFFERLDKSVHQIVTWNGNGFDLPFVYKRATLRGIFPPYALTYYTKRYLIRPHCDLMQVWAGWDNRNWEKLDTVARAFGLEGKTDFDVTKIPELLETEEGKEKLREYCLQDCKLTHHLYNRMQGILFN